MGDRVGQLFGNYQVLRLLGKGNFADVYLCEHRFLDISAAIKILHVHLTAKTHELFLREARTLAHLDHAHIIRIIDFGLQGETPYLIMEYAPNGTLRTLHPKGTRLSLEQIVDIVRQLAPALDYAHEQRVIHRDIKPENILINAKNKLVISDFGIAVVQQTLDSLSLQKAAGTPLYMAPEQIQGRPCAASDQYALGALVYEWLAGEPPFQGAVYELLAQHLHETPPSLRTHVPSLSSAIEDVVFAALSKNPEQRFSSVEDFAIALEEACFATLPLPKQVPSSIRQELSLPKAPPIPQAMQLAAPVRPEANSQHAPLLIRHPQQQGDGPAFNQPTYANSTVMKPNNPSLARTNRQRLLRRVRSIWIEGVLEHSLHGAALLALGLHEQPDAVANPWHLVLHFPDATSRPLQPETRIIQAYDEANGELLILGAPGSGKTTLLLELARDLIERAEREEEGPVPVIFNLSSWATRQQPLADWLVEELNIKYQVPRKLGRTLVDAEQILPLLDGLDEVAAKDRTACIQAINTYREEHGLLPLVVCSRHADYLAQETRVLLHNAVMIQPLTQRQIETYLHSLGTPMLPLYQAMQTDAELRELATSPLMLSILTLTYQGTPRKQIANNGTLSTRQHQVFSAYVQRMLQRSNSTTPYTSQQTLHWLTQLAQQMKRHNQSVFYIERMQPTWLTKKRTYALYPRYVEGIIFGLISIVFITSYFAVPLTSYFIDSLNFELIWMNIPQGTLSWLVPTVVGGLLSGLLNGLLAPSIVKNKPDRSMRPAWKRIQGYASRGVFNGLLGILALFISFMNTMTIGTFLDLGASAFLGVGGLFILSDILIGTRPTEVLPAEIFRWSWSRMIQNLFRFLLFGLLSVLLVGLLIGLGTGLFNLAFGLDATPFSSFQWEFGIAISTVQITGPFIILLSGLVGAITRGLSKDTLDEQILVKPNEGIHRSARRSAITGLIVGLISGLSIGLVTWFGFFRTGSLWGTILLAMIPLIGLLSGLRSGGIACIQHIILRILLRHYRSIPWNYPRFLDYATDHVLLHKIGGGYIFVHRLLLEYFASLESTQLSEVAVLNGRQDTLSTPTLPLTISRRKVITGAAAIGTAAIGGGFAWWLYHPRPIYTYRGHTASVDVVAWSPDGKYIASASYKDGVQVWNVANGSLVYTHRIPNSQAAWSFNNKLAWSPDSKRIASAMNSGSRDDLETVEVWDALNGTHRYIYNGHNGYAILNLAWSSNGKYIATSDERAIQVWNAMNGELIFTHQGPMIGPKTAPPSFDLTWSSNSRYIASTGVNIKLEVWNAQDGKVIATYPIPGMDTSAESVTWSPDGKYIAFRQYNRSSSPSIRVWNPFNGKIISTLTDYTSNGSTLAWSPDSKYIASKDSNETVYAWNAFDGSLRFSHWAASQINAISWSPDGKRIATGSGYGLVQIWDASGS